MVKLNYYKLGKEFILGGIIWKKTKIIFFDIKDYDKEFFKKYADDFNFDMTFFESKID